MTSINLNGKSASMESVKSERLQKVIANRGLASRREAENWIEEGRVRVNGVVARLGDKCLPGQDQVEVDGAPLPRQAPPRLVLAMNKPRGILCTNDDPHGGRTVFDLLPPEMRELKLFCVGRLDKDSEGLLLVTNDGKLRQELTHPSYQVVKKYAVEIDRPLEEKDVKRLLRGVEWEGERLSVDKVFPFGSRSRRNWKKLEVTLQHGRKREIRRLFYAFGYKVKRLQRFQIGHYQLKGIPRGQFKRLDKRETRLFFER